MLAGAATGAAAQRRIQQRLKPISPLPEPRLFAAAGSGLPQGLNFGQALAVEPVAIPVNPDRATVFTQVPAVAVAAAALLQPGSQLRKQASQQGRILGQLGPIETR